VLALFNLFGQRPETATVDTPSARLAVYSPTALRGGLLFTSRFHVTAHKDIRKALLILAPGWIEDMQVNSITPEPRSAGSRDGRIVLDLGPIAAGHSVITFIEFQVNPTNVGHRSQDVELDDGSRPLLHIERSVTVFP